MTPMATRLGRDLGIASRILRKDGLPVSLIFFVTSKCNLLCKHCFYWEELNLPKNELSLEEIEKISLSLPNLLTVSLTGGEPYLRPDLPQIAAAFERNSGTRNIQIPSNGLLVDRTVDRLEELLGLVKLARVATGVSLDGPREIHNQIRQDERSFDRALETLSAMKALKPKHPNLSVGVALTVTAANQDCLEDFYRFVDETLQPDAITITLTRGNPIDQQLLEVDLSAYNDFASRVLDYRRSHRLTDGWTDRIVIAKEAETYRLIREAASAESRISPCYAGHLIGILSETGKVFVCEMLDKQMGNVRDFDCDLAALWRSEQAEEARQYQLDKNCQCTYECAMSVNTLFNPKRSLRILWNALF